MSFLTRLGVTFAALSLSACSLVYKPAGGIVYSYTEHHAVPYTMSTTDLDMACSMTGSMLPVLMSFTEFRADPNRNAVVMNMLMGNCAELQAAEEVLSYVQALKAQNVNAARDARIREKRAYKVTAERQYAAYRYMMAEFGEPGGHCPKLKKKDEIYWALGNLAGLQAVLSDLRSESEAGVPKDVAMKAVRGIQCIDNQRWWGLPQSLQAGLWLMMPDTAPTGTDPWQAMQQAQQIATETGVRLAHAVAAILADSTGHPDELRQIIRNHGQSLKDTSGSQEYALIDLIGSRHVQAISDRLWIEGTGARTPIGALGTFWDDPVKNPVNTIDIDDLLGD